MDLFTKLLLGTGLLLITSSITCHAAATGHRVVSDVARQLPESAVRSHMDPKSTDNSTQMNTTGIPVDRHAEIRERIPDAMWPVYFLTTSFLDVVQLKYFTHLNETFGFESFYDIGQSFDDDGWVEWLLYFIGFAICLTVGIIMTIGMLVGGIIFPCCRCCGKGGKQDDDEADEHSSCCFRTFCCCCSCLKCCPARDRLFGRIALIVIVDVILILGVLCILYSNEQLNTQLAGEQTVFDNINTGFSEIEPFMESAIEDLDTWVVHNYSDASDVVFNRLDALPRKVMFELNNITGVLNATITLHAFTDQMSPQLINSLANVTENSIQLQNESSVLNNNLTMVTSEILDDLNAICHQPDIPHDCWEISNITAELMLNVDYSIVNVSSAQDIITTGLENNLVDVVQYLYGNLSEIMHAVNNSIHEHINDAKQTSDELVNKMEQFILDLEYTLNDLNSSKINETMTDVEYFIVEEYDIDGIIYWAVIGMVQVLIIIIATNIVGLIYVSCPQARKGDSCLACSRAHGANWLLASTGFTFIGYWAFMATVVLMFAAGGGLYTEVCRNIMYYQDSKPQGVLDVFDSMIAGTLNYNVTIGLFDAYATCETNASIYNALNMAENGFNITEMLNLTYVEEALNLIKSTEHTIPEITLHGPTLSYILSELDMAAALDYSAMKDELTKAVTTVNMTQLAIMLETLESNDTLYDNIAELKKLDADASQIHELALATVQYVDTIMYIFPSMNFTEMGNILNTTEQFVNVNGTKYVSHVVNETADSLLTAITNEMNSIIFNVEYLVGRCRPLYDAVTMVVNTVCTDALYTINSLWFSMGWCVFFLLPHLTMSFTMINVYRKKLPARSSEERKQRKQEKKQKKAEKKQRREEKAEEKTLKQEAVATTSNNRISKYDEVQFDNLGFDPMEEYRKEVSDNAENQTTTSHPSFEAFDSKTPGKPWVLPVSTKMSPPRADDHALSAEVPPPDYDDVVATESELAPLY